MSRRVAALVASAVLCTLPVTTGFSVAVPSVLAARGVPTRLPEGTGAQRPPSCAVAQLAMSGRRVARVAPRDAPGGSTAKRAGRLGKLVMTELVGILRSPYLLKVAAGNDVDAELASLISIVEVDMSGDNKVAKVLVSAMGNDIEKKKAVQWLNKNAKAIRFSLAQRIAHLKSVPELRFSASALPQVQILGSQYTVSLYSKSARTLTFENFCHRLWRSCPS
jgi:ribosome-binding factor A